MAALEYLLAVEQETIYRQAAEASAGLGRATNGRYMLRLLSPLACLLVPSKASEAAQSAAAAMQSILVTVRPQKASGGTMDDDPIWKVLQESDALKHILWRLDEHHSAVCAEVLAMILERWPGARYRVGQVQAVRSSLLALCMSGNEAVAMASLRVCQALGVHHIRLSILFFDIVVFSWIVLEDHHLQDGTYRVSETVLCAGVAVLFLQDGNSLWKTLACCLQQSKTLLVNREALRFLSLLGVGILDYLNLDQSFPRRHLAFDWVIMLVEKKTHGYVRD